ncbi:MAG: nitrogen-fixing NifU-like protein [Candidatus Sulfotelmatobacter sp.]|nr:nitrogen-fixing NifU-like protein [Candidatus Sulfotelmatobacter sp.]
MADLFSRGHSFAQLTDTAPLPFTIEVPMYSAQLLDHFQNPRNAGEIANADATVEIENPACGDVLRLTLKACAGRIIHAQFKAKGCVAAIACGSALTELMLEKTLEEARNLRREDIIAAVGGLPQASTHAAHLALDALMAGLRQIKT